MQSQFISNHLLGDTIYEECINAACAKHQLMKTEMDILLFLHNNPGYDTATDVVRLRHLSKSHVSKSIQSLKERGFLTTFHKGSNRRTIHLKLCTTADDAIADGLKAQNQFAEILVAGFTAEEKNQFLKYLCRIADNLQVYFQNKSI